MKPQLTADISPIASAAGESSSYRTIAGRTKERTGSERFASRRRSSAASVGIVSVFISVITKSQTRPAPRLRHPGQSIVSPRAKASVWVRRHLPTHSHSVQRTDIRLP